MACNLERTGSDDKLSLSFTLCTAVYIAEPEAQEAGDFQGKSKELGSGLVVTALMKLQLTFPLYFSNQSLLVLCLLL